MIDTKELRQLAEAAQIDQAKGMYGNEGYCQFKTEMQPAIVLELLDELDLKSKTLEWNQKELSEATHSMQVKHDRIVGLLREREKLIAVLKGVRADREHYSRDYSEATILAMEACVDIKTENDQ